jgi:hypothetical protein
LGVLPALSSAPLAPPAPDGRSAQAAASLSAALRAAQGPQSAAHSAPLDVADQPARTLGDPCAQAADSLEAQPLRAGPDCRLCSNRGRSPPRGATAGATAGAPTCRTIGVRAGASARNRSTCAGSIGRPPFAASACCLAAKETGGRGGAFRTTTVRSTNRAGGAATGGPAWAITLARIGAMGATATTCALAITVRSTATTDTPTGLAETKVSRETTVIELLAYDGKTLARALAAGHWST